MANKGYDPRNKVNFDAKVNDQGKTVRDEINEAMAIGKEDKVNYRNQVAELLQGEVEQEMFNYVQSIDKSVYAEVLNNQALTRDILSLFRQDDVFKHIQSADQVQRLQNIFTDHLTVKARRAEIMAKEQAGQQITAEERSVLDQKTSFETYMDRATKNYFVQKIQDVEYYISQAREEALFTNYHKNADQIKKALNRNLALYRSGGRGGFGVSFNFHKKDVSPIFYDSKALDQYASSLIEIREKFKTQSSVLAVHRESSKNLETAGDNWKGAARRYNIMTDAEAVAHFKRPKEKISQYEYDKENLKRLINKMDDLHKRYNLALDNFHKLEQYIYDHPEVKDYLDSPEYLEVMKLEYHEGTYEGKSFSEMTSLDQQNYVLDKYGCAELRTIPPEHREAYSLARDKKAQEELRDLEDKFEDAGQRIKMYWGDRPVTPEMEIQKLELEENRAIIDALRNCVTKNSPENEAKYVEAVKTAYDNAKQRYLDNPELRDRMDLRAKQLDKGDFSFVPISNQQMALSFDMSPIWSDDTTRFTKEMKETARVARENSFLTRSYLERVKPLVQPQFQIQIENERQAAREYTLKQMARDLDKEDLEAYKTDINNRRMEKLEYTRDEFKLKLDALSEQKDALKKQHGFFTRVFSSKYRESAKEIDQKIDGLRKAYKSEQDKARYDILKTYQEKGLAMTRSEANELKSLTKEAAKTGDLQKWDKERAEEKRKIEEYNKTFYGTEMEKPQETKESVPTTTQLDLGARIHNHKTVEQPIKEETVKENTIAKEQKTLEEKDIEI